MTREEAIKIYWEKVKLHTGVSWQTDAPPWVSSYIDAYIALGMLTVQEAPLLTIKERLWIALTPVREKYVSPDEIDKLLRAAKLKVVDE